MTLYLTRRSFISTTAAALTLLSLPAAAAGDDALAFAQSLYKLDGLWSDIAKDRAKYLGPELIAAMTANDKFGDNPDYALDYDPLVQAQDWDELKDLKFTVEQSSADKATIRVDFTNMEDPTTVRLNLVHTPQRLAAQRRPRHRGLQPGPGIHGAQFGRRRRRVGRYRPGPGG